MQVMVKSLLNDTFIVTHSLITDLKLEKGLALQDIVTDIHEFIANVDFSQ